MRCQVFGSPSATASNAKPPAILTSASSLPKCAATASIALLACGGIGKIDAAEFDPVGRCRNLRWRVIEARHPRAARKRCFRDHAAERARGAGHDNDFSVHDGLRLPEDSAH